MQWDDIGFLISKNKYNENSIIAEVFTKDHGKCSGIIFGATSKKIKNYLQTGNQLHVNYNYKNEGKIGYFKIEIMQAFTPRYFENKKKLFCILSAMHLVKLLTVELQENTKVFNLLSNFFNIFDKDEWVKDYIFWELKLLEYVGFSLQLKNMVKCEIHNNKKKYYVQSKLEKRYIPNFLVEDNEENLNNKNIIQGLKLVEDFLEKNVLKPNNLNYPTSRLEFISLFKQ